MGWEDAYHFRPAHRRDLALLRPWLRTEEVMRWWGDPEEQAALLEGDLGEPLMEMLIVSYADQPFAYAQHYEVHSWPQPHLAELPVGSSAIDTFIGEPRMIGRGHGAAFLRLLARQLRREGAPEVAIDPAPKNLRARRAFARAGFVEQRYQATVNAIVMLFRDGSNSRMIDPSAR